MGATGATMPVQQREDCFVTRGCWSDASRGVRPGPVRHLRRSRHPSSRHHRTVRDPVARQHGDSRGYGVEVACEGRGRYVLHVDWMAPHPVRRRPHSTAWSTTTSWTRHTRISYRHGGSPVISTLERVSSVCKDTTDLGKCIVQHTWLKLAVKLLEKGHEGTTARRAWPTSWAAQPIRANTSGQPIGGQPVGEIIIESCCSDVRHLPTSHQYAVDVAM